MDTSEWFAPWPLRWRARPTPSARRTSRATLLLAAMLVCSYGLLGLLVGALFSSPLLGTVIGVALALAAVGTVQFLRGAATAERTALIPASDELRRRADEIETAA